MGDFDPTHCIPESGLEARERPDPTIAAQSVLAAGLAVLIRQRQADWAEVLCDNGWTGWVDGRALVAIGQQGAASDAVSGLPSGTADDATGAGTIGVIGVAGIVGAAGGAAAIDAALGSGAATGAAGAAGATGIPGAAAVGGAVQAVGTPGSATVGGAVQATGAPGTSGVGGAVQATGAPGTSGVGGAVQATGAPGASGVGGAVQATGAPGTSGVGGAVQATGAPGASGVSGADESATDGLRDAAVFGAAMAAGSVASGPIGPSTPTPIDDMANTGIAGTSAVGGAVNAPPATPSAVGGAVHAPPPAPSVMGGAVQSAPPPGAPVAMMAAADVGSAPNKAGGGRAKRSLFAVVAAVIAGLLMLAPVGAAIAQNVSSTGAAGADLTGCKGAAESLSQQGAPVGSVSAPGARPSSPSNPFVVDTDGRVPWKGSTDAVITNNTWRVQSYGIPLKSGGGSNDKQDTAKAGDEAVKDYLKVPLVGLFEVSGNLTGTGGQCNGSMWVKVNGSPLGTPAWIAGVLLLAVGVVIVFFARPRPRKGTV